MGLLIFTWKVQFNISLNSNVWYQLQFSLFPPSLYLFSCENMEGVSFQEDNVDCLFYSFIQFLNVLYGFLSFAKYFCSTVSFNFECTVRFVLPFHSIFGCTVRVFTILV